MQQFATFAHFESASRAVLAFLHQRLGFELWMVTRTEGDNWIVLQAEDHGYGVKDGSVFRWADSFCSQMVQGFGPCIAPKSDLIPSYVNAPIGKQVNIAAYVGVPLSDADGSLFGTLCAIDPKVQPESLHTELPLIQLLGQMLSCMLASEMKAAAAQRLSERTFLKPSIDLATGLLNNVGWQNVMEAEERRCKLYGHPACIVSIQLQGAAPNYLHACKAIKSCLGPNDSAAMLSPNHLVIMGAERNAESSQILHSVVQSSLKAAAIEAQVGIANRDPRLGMSDAFAKATA